MSNIPWTKDYVQHNTGIMNEPVPQTSRDIPRKYIMILSHA